jgi:hypothetical protein
MVRFRTAVGFSEEYAANGHCQPWKTAGAPTTFRGSSDAARRGVTGAPLRRCVTGALTKVLQGPDRETGLHREVKPSSVAGLKPRA